MPFQFAVFLCVLGFNGFFDCFAAGFGKQVVACVLHGRFQVGGGAFPRVVGYKGRGRGVVYVGFINALATV